MMRNYIRAFKTREGAEAFKKAYDSNLSLWDVEYEELYVTTHYGETHIITTGNENAPPIILLHGFGFGSTMWYPNIKEFSKTHRVFAIDILADFNLSIVSKAFNDRKDCADWLLEVMNRLGMDKALICGHSAGGWQALNFSCFYPERVKKLVLLAPAASFIPFRKQFFARLFSIMMYPNQSYVIKHFCNWFVAPGNNVVKGLFEQFYLGLKNYKYAKTIVPSVLPKAELDRLKAPLLILVGDKEVIYSYNQLINKVQQILPHAEYQIIKDAGHALSIEKAEEVNKAVVNFIN